MNLKIKTDCESYQWILDNVYQKAGGEFTVFSKKKEGVRLYLNFNDPKILGRFKVFYGFEKDGHYTTHQDAFVWQNEIYEQSLVGKTLVEALLKHSELFKVPQRPEDVREYFGNYPYISSPEIEYFSGSLQEFVNTYNENEERVRRNNYYNIPVEMFRKVWE